ncbi:MAG: DNA-deoxyinosine glycosylase [Oscillospiraceae bacterium]|jgi:TDG/mug DNA glycosylase family protein
MQDRLPEKHNIEPFAGPDPGLLILGSFPSPMSRSSGFYYGNPRNRFWAVLASLTGSIVPVSNDDKKEFLAEHGIALWDVVAECTVVGASDSSIRDAVYNDVSAFAAENGVRAAAFNGSTAKRLFLGSGQTFPEGIKVLSLPSTSPANAAWSLERLISAWSVMSEFLRP